MAGEAVSVSVEQPPDYARTLTRLKSKISGEGGQRASPGSSSSKLQCPKVPEKLLRDANAQDYVVPKLMFLGPYHYDLAAGETLKLKLTEEFISECEGPYHYDLAAGETLKLKLTEEFISECEGTVDQIYNSIYNIVRELKGCYEDEAAEKFSNAEFTEMMLVDGCALLWYIICVCVGVDHKDYGIRYQDLSLLHQDALLLENQLPYQLLQLLMDLLKLSSDSWTIIFQEFFGMIEESSFQEFFGMKEKPFPQRMKDYCCRLSLSVIRSIKGRPEPKPTEESNPKPKEESKPFLQRVKDYCCRLPLSVIRSIKGRPEPKPAEEPNSKPKEQSQTKPEKESKRPCNHLLDLYRRNFLGDDEFSRKERHRKDETSVTDANEAKVPDIKEQLMASFRNVMELKAAGIRIKPSPTRYLRDISFSSNGITADLRLPRITIDKSTKTLFFNLIAYEMSSDVPHDFISYLRFLDSLIDHADDVKELQSAGVLQNNLGTIEEVADLFNTVSAKLDSNFLAYRDVRVKIRKHLDSHYNRKPKRWMTQFLDTHCGSPWTIIAWIAAALALFLTAVQTYFSAFSR